MNVFQTQVCNDPKANENANIDQNDKEFHFLCMDLTFIYALLKDGFGVPDDKAIHVNQILL